MWAQMEFVWWYILHNSTEAFRSKGSKWLLLHRIDLEQQYPRDVANPLNIYIRRQVHLQNVRVVSVLKQPCFQDKFRTEMKFWLKDTQF